MKQLLSLAMDIGEQMLLCGGEVHRAEESVQRMCKALGAERVDVFVITSSMVATVFSPEGTSYTQTRRITTSDTDFERLHRLNALSRKICEKKLSEEKIEEELEAALNSKPYPFFLSVISYAVIAAAFTLFFGGTLKESFVSLFMGAAVRFAIAFAEKTSFNKIFSKFSASVVSTFLAFLALKSGVVADVDKIIIGNIMSLIPGIGLTNALRDLFMGDSIAGLLRFVEASLIALAIAAGYFLVVVLGGFMA